MTYDVVLTGPESSGKTSLAAHLSQTFKAPWVPEAARRFVETDPRMLSAETVEPIARLAMAMDDEARASAPPLLIHDTDLVSTVVYARHYYGFCPPWIFAEAQARLADLYLLCLPDLPWESDGVRDRPTQRMELLAQFREALHALDANYTIVGGVDDVRRTAAELALRRRLR